MYIAFAIFVVVLFIVIDEVLMKRCTRKIRESLRSEEPHESRRDQ